MDVSFHTKSSTPQPVEKSAKEIRSSIQQVVPGAEVSIAKVNDKIIGFFSSQEIEELSPSALLSLVKKVAPEGVVVDWNFKNAPETVLKQHFLLPAPQSREIKLKGFAHLTPSFMEALAEARPNLRKIDLRMTKGTAQLIGAYLSRQVAPPSPSNEAVEKELRGKMAIRAELFERQNDLTLKEENLTREIAVLKDLAKKAEEAAKESPTIATYRKQMELKGEELEEKLSTLSEMLAQQKGQLTALTAEIETLSGAIDPTRDRALDSAAVEILIDGSDLGPHEKKELYNQYPQIVLLAKDTTLDLSHSRFSIGQIRERLERLPQVKQVDLKGNQEPLDLLDILDLEKKFGVQITYTSLQELTPGTMPLSTELLSQLLLRFPELSTVNLKNWKEATPFDILYLEEAFSNVQFTFPPLDIYSEDALERFVNLVETEFRISHWVLRHHALHLRLLHFLKAPSKFFKAWKDPEKRKIGLAKRTGWARSWFKINSTLLPILLWAPLSWILTPIVYLFEQSSPLLLFLEKICKLFQGDRGISHATFVGTRRPLFEEKKEPPLPDRPPFHRERKWE